MSVAVMVSYPAGPEASFDRDYYVEVHLPLVRSHFGPHGMTDITGYFPEADAPVLAVAILRFVDSGARDAALGSAEAAAVFGDIPNFTNVQPTPLPLSVA